MTTLFISDLHLDNTRPEVSSYFLKFLRDDALQAEALYILGDLFEAWIGDDNNDPGNQQVIKGLKALVTKQVPVYFIHGNRDFLIGNSFAEQSGVTLLEEHTVIDLYGTPTLIMHGDTLCTLDSEYLAFRQQVRDPNYQQHFLQKPLAERQLIAQQIRAQSKAKNELKAENIMDVTPEEVVNIMQTMQVQQLIHGHTHRPNKHHLTVNSQEAWRIVLGPWETHSSVLVCDANGQQLTSHDISSN